MTDKTQAQAAKALGNKEFSAKNYREAIKHFTDAIGFDASDHVFYSNRSACYASLEEYQNAYDDAKKCVELKPDWAKGYTRRGLAEFFLGRVEEAEATYKKGLELAPGDAALQNGLNQCLEKKNSPKGLAIDTNKLMQVLQMPKYAEYMKDQKFSQALTTFMTSGGSQQVMMSLIQTEPRLLEVIMESMNMGEVSGPTAAEPFKPEPKKEEPKKEEPKDERTEESKTADEFKNLGNTEYKKKNFEEALKYYDQAIAAQPNDLTYVNNKAAVYLEMGEFDKVMALCEAALEKRYDMNSALAGGGSFEKVAKVFARMASCQQKQHKYDEAIDFYRKALTEDNNRFIRNSLRECEKARDKHAKESYHNPALAEEHREKGNEFFKAQNYVEAKKEYDEAVKRNPKDCKLYSNRAAALTKLGAYPDALRDLDEAIKIDPTFVKAYSRKGAAHFFMKEYHKALEAYDRGIAVDPNNEECKQGRLTVVHEINANARSGEVDEEQVRKAMADPEIQKILRDPNMSLVLQQMQENPARIQEYMNDPQIASNLSKLMAAGIVKMG